MDALNKSISIAGSQRALGESIGLGQTAVANWIKRGGIVPVEHCTPIETALLGKVTRKELRPDDWQIHWPELALAHSLPAQPATQTVAEAQSAIKHVEAVAVAAIRQGAGQATAEIKHLAGEILKEAEPWDGATERRQEVGAWDGKTERRKLDAPLDRRVSAESVARAEFLRTQAATKKQDATGLGA